MIEGHVVADLGGLADHAAHPVVDEDAAPELRPGVDLDPGQDAPDMGDQPADEQQSRTPRRMGEAVEQDGREPRIAEHDLQPRAPGRIALGDRVDILSEPLQSPTCRPPFRSGCQQNW